MESHFYSTDTFQAPTLGQALSFKEPGMEELLISPVSSYFPVGDPGQAVQLAGNQACLGPQGGWTCPCWALL